MVVRGVIVDNGGRDKHKFSDERRWGREERKQETSRKIRAFTSYIVTNPRFRVKSSRFDSYREGSICHWNRKVCDSDRIYSFRFVIVLGMPPSCFLFRLRRDLCLRQQGQLWIMGLIRTPPSSLHMHDLQANVHDSRPCSINIFWSLTTL